MLVHKKYKIWQQTLNGNSKPAFVYPLWPLCWPDPDNLWSCLLCMVVGASSCSAVVWWWICRLAKVPASGCSAVAAGFRATLARCTGCLPRHGPAERWICHQAAVWTGTQYMSLSPCVSVCLCVQSTMSCECHCLVVVCLCLCVCAVYNELWMSVFYHHLVMSDRETDWPRIRLSTNPTVSNFVHFCSQNLLPTPPAFGNFIPRSHYWGFTPGSLHWGASIPQIFWATAPKWKFLVLQLAAVVSVIFVIGMVCEPGGHVVQAGDVRQSSWGRDSGACSDWPSVLPASSLVWPVCWPHCPAARPQLRRNGNVSFFTIITLTFRPVASPSRHFEKM